MFAHALSRMKSPLPIACLLAVLFLTSATAFELKLATENDAIFSADPSQFYMYTNRTHLDGTSSKPWSAGRWGFVRNEKKTDIGIVMTKFHEGIDIRPVRRDSSGNPLDEVRAISAGTVVYANAVSSRSSYGNYVVVKHHWDGCEYYSLYAHLRSVAVSAGQQVSAGDELGGLGFTGAGINRERSHLHLEIALLHSPRFETWYGKHFTSTNHHGIYSGFNLTGVDAAALYHSHKANPAITMAEFVRLTPVYYKVVVPNNGMLNVVQRYPWLQTEQGSGPSWEISFTQTGIPVEVVPSSKAVTYPAISYVRPSKLNHSYATMGRITGVGDSAQLTGSGSRAIQLWTEAF